VCACTFPPLNPGECGVRQHLWGGYPYRGSGWCKPLTRITASDGSQLDSGQSGSGHSTRPRPCGQPTATGGVDGAVHTVMGGGPCGGRVEGSVAGVYTAGQSHQVSDRILSKYAWSQPARFCLAAMPPWAEGSWRSKLRASFRMRARFWALSPFRVRLLSSPMATSSTQWTRFSISQWVRITRLARCASA
jgi:hypothetical protein